MKIALASDLHIEFHDLEITNDQHADVLILSGDICVAEHLKYDMPSEHDIASAPIKHVWCGIISSLNDAAKDSPKCFT
jgi:predicted phosphodiesterase